MKRNLLFVLVFMCFLAGIPVGIYAQEYLYVYAPNGQENSFAIDNIRKITFTGEAMSVLQTDGGAVQMPYSDISLLTFVPQIGSGTKEIKTNPGIKVYIADGTLFVESEEELTTISLYNMQGTLLQNTTPRSLTASLSLRNAPVGVYVVRILSRSGVSNYKIINC